MTITPTAGEAAWRHLTSSSSTTLIGCERRWLAAIVSAAADQRTDGPTVRPSVAVSIIDIALARHWSPSLLAITHRRPNCIASIKRIGGLPSFRMRTPLNLSSYDTSITTAWWRSLISAMATLACARFVPTTCTAWSTKFLTLERCYTHVGPFMHIILLVKTVWINLYNISIIDVQFH